MVKAVGIETFNHFGSSRGENHQRWGSVALVGIEQFGAGGGVQTHFPFFKDDFFRFEKNLHDLAGETAGLGEEQDSKRHTSLQFYASAYSITVVIFAVLSSMAETEQYFSFERWTASSTALRDTLPPMR